MQLSLLLFLGICCVCLRAAPSSSSREQLVRVYRINEEQYDRMLKLTEGKNVISEARLINGGFATVSESLSSGWHSLLRIVGLTTISKADEEAKLDIDGQPLCVIKTREGEGQFRGESSARSSGKAYEDDIDEEPIHCIVVLKNGEEEEQELPTLEYSSSFNNYWSVPQTQEVSMPQSSVGDDITQPPKMEEEEKHETEVHVEVDEKETDKDEQEGEQTQEQEEQEQKEEEVATTEAPPKSKLTKKKQKYNQSRTNSNSQSANDSSSRQYVPSYPYPQYPPLAPYPPSSPYPPTSPYGSYNPYIPPPPPPPYGQQPFGGQSPYGLYNPQSYGPYGPQSYYGQPSTYPYGPYGFYDQSSASQSTTENENDDDLEDDSSYEYVAQPEVEYQVYDNDWRYDNE